VGTISTLVHYITCAIWYTCQTCNKTRPTGPLIQFKIKIVSR